MFQTNKLPKSLGALLDTRLVASLAAGKESESISISWQTGLGLSVAGATSAGNKRPRHRYAFEWGNRIRSSQSSLQYGIHGASSWKCSLRQTGSRRRNGGRASRKGVAENYYTTPFLRSDCPQSLGSSTLETSSNNSQYCSPYVGQVVG